MDGGAGGRIVVALTLLLSAAPAIRLSAQTVTLGPQVLLGDYREVSSALRYRGAGVGGAATLTYRKASLEVAYVQLRYDPTDEGSAEESFHARQFDGRLRYYLTGGVSAEVGVTSRRADPEFAAQSVGAARAGVRLSNAVGSGVRLGLRGNYLPGARFSGGGRAPVGLEVGFGAAGEFARGRVRLTADYEFQYFDRKTGAGTAEVSVPVQQALVRLGGAVAF
jgi:hypothetical protein